MYFAVIQKFARHFFLKLPFGRHEVGRLDVVNRYKHRTSAIIMSNYLLQRTFKQGS